MTRFTDLGRSIPPAQRKSRGLAVPAPSCPLSLAPARALPPVPCRLFPAVYDSTAEFGPAAAELRLQSLHDRTMHLADAALGKVERGADFFHRQLFIIVENDDQP